jgi:type I restriction enzyme S subunit
MMKEGWKYKKISDVCTFFNDGNWIESKDQSNEGIRLIQTGNIGNGKFLNKDDHSHYISVETFNKLRCTEIFEGDCLISRLPEPIGRSCLLPKIDERAVTAVDCSILRFVDSILPNFFVYYTQCDYYSQSLKKYETGLTRKRISRINLGGILIPVPPFPVQQRIVSHLDKINEIIDKLRDTLNALNKAEQAIFYDMFGDDSNYQKVFIGNIFELTSGGTPSKSIKQYYDGGTIPWLRSGEIKDTYINNTELYITDEGLQHSSAKYIPINTVVLAMYGATVGQVGIIKKRMTTNQAICSLLPNKSFVPEFLYYYLSSKKEYFGKLAAGGAQPNISQNTIKRTEIILPPLSLQQSFASRIEVIEAQKQKIQTSIDKFQEMLDGAMDNYFGD